MVDGFGDISVRHDKFPEHLLLSCNRAPRLFLPENILAYDLNGDLAEHSTQRSYLERFIHSEIYRVRPDVMSVVHSHSPSVIPFGATGHRLRPIFYMSGFLGSCSTLFENRAGASGNIGAETVVRSPADGYTLLLQNSTMVVNPAVNGKLNYDPEKDLTLIMLLGLTPIALVAH